MGTYNVVVLDFETTGLSPNLGERAIEVGAVLLNNNQIIDRFQSLMNPGKKISSFIEDYTGITNKMLSSAPSIAQAMGELKDFIGGHDLVAHNASFDYRILRTEFNRLGYNFTKNTLCTVVLSIKLIKIFIFNFT